MKKNVQMFVSSDECRKMVDWLIENAGKNVEAVIGENGKKIAVTLRYAQPVKYDGKPAHFFTMVDNRDPFTKSAHGYPKIYVEGEFDSFYSELKREWDYIKSIHKAA